MVKKVQSNLRFYWAFWSFQTRSKKNPLNDKAIGPDRSVALGRAFVRSYGDTARVTYGVEHLPISDGDVAADFRIRGGEHLGEVWATLVRKPK